MVEAGDEIWTVVTADFGADSCGGVPEFRVESSGTTKESAEVFLKLALAEFFYENFGYSHNFPEISAAVNAFVDGTAASFDDDVLNWRKADVDNVSILGDGRLAHIVKLLTSRGDIQYRCFSRSFVLAKVFVVQCSFIEELEKEMGKDE